MSPRRARIRPAGAGPSTGDRPRCRHRPGRSAVTAEHPSPRPVCELLFELSSVAGAAAGAYVAAPPRALAISYPFHIFLVSPAFTPLHYNDDGSPAIPVVARNGA